MKVRKVSKQPFKVKRGEFLKRVEGLQYVGLMIIHWKPQHY